jgi:uncharacterized repeat protein (TIGR01451 family)
MKRIVLLGQILGLILASQAFGAGETRTTNTLYVEQMSNRVIEVNRCKNVVWSYGNSGELSNPSDAERLPNGNTLIADTGNNRVIEVGPAPNYGTSLVFYSDNYLGPRDAERKGTATVIAFPNCVGVAEQGNAQALIWQYGCNNAIDVEWLPNGHILVADGDGTVSEVFYPNQCSSTILTGLNNLKDVEWLPNGHILITQGLSGSAGTVTEMATGTGGWITIWQHTTTPQYPPYDAERLSDGNTLVGVYCMSSAGDPDLYDVTSSGTKTWQYGYGNGYLRIVDVEEILGTDTIYNTAFMYYKNEGQKPMPYAAAFATNTLHITYVPIGTPSIKLIKEVSPKGTISKDGTLTYTITFMNEGDGTATACVLYDAIPAGCELDGAATSNYCGAEIKYSNDGGGSWNVSPTLDVTTIRWNLGAIGPGDTDTCCFTVKVK